VVAAGHSGLSPEAVTCQHCDTVHTTLVGIEPTTFRLLVRRATSNATDSPTEPTVNWRNKDLVDGVVSR